MYAKFGNLNSLLGWGHAKVIENLLQKKPDCPRSLSDKFADARVIERSLRGDSLKLISSSGPSAESDMAVAAASILAREAFIDWLDRQGKRAGIDARRGVSAPVKEAAAKVVEKGGADALRRWPRFISGRRMRLRQALSGPPPRRPLAEINQPPTEAVFRQDSCS